jgi:hypothetical protein
MLIAFHLLIMSKPRNKPKQALNIKGSRHRTLSYAMHDLLRRYGIVQIVILQLGITIISAARLI